MSLDFFQDPKLPDHPVSCPWPDNQAMRQRLLEVTRLSEEKRPPLPGLQMLTRGPRGSPTWPS